jgi:hypothetical protein
MHPENLKNPSYRILYELGVAFIKAWFLDMRIEEA